MVYNPNQENTMTRPIGVDISHWDGMFDPAKATKPIDFVIQKASESLFPDPKFAAFRDSIMKVPIRGAYHYFRSTTDWRLQAEFFISVVRGLDFHFYVLDYEKIGNVLDENSAHHAHNWIDYVGMTLGKPVLLYTNPAHYDANLWPYGDWMKDYPLWLAQYWTTNVGPEREPALPKKRAAGDWRIWQWASEINYVGHGHEYGCGGNSVDLNVFNGTVADMRAWLKLCTPPPPTPPPPPPVGQYIVVVAAWIFATPNDGLNCKIVGRTVVGLTVKANEIAGEWASLSTGWVRLKYLKRG